MRKIRVQKQNGTILSVPEKLKKYCVKRGYQILPELQDVELSKSDFVQAWEGPAEPEEVEQPKAEFVQVEQVDDIEEPQELEPPLEISVAQAVVPLMNDIKGVQSIKVLNTAMEHEKEGKNRKTIIKAIEKRIKELNG